MTTLNEQSSPTASVSYSRAPYQQANDGQSSNTLREAADRYVAWQRGHVAKKCPANVDPRAIRVHHLEALPPSRLATTDAPRRNGSIAASTTVSTSRPSTSAARQAEDTCRAGGDGGAGPWAGAGRPRGADAFAGRCGAAPQHRLIVCLTSDSAARSGRMPAEGKPQPSLSSCSRSVPDSRRIAAFCSPGGGRAVDIRLSNISDARSNIATAHTPHICVVRRSVAWCAP